MKAPDRGSAESLRACLASWREVLGAHLQALGTLEASVGTTREAESLRRALDTLHDKDALAVLRRELRLRQGTLLGDAGVWGDR